MNKYAARSILFDIAAGVRFVIIERDQREVTEAVKVFAAENERMEWGAVVRHSPGAADVTHSGGGRIVFTTPRSNRMRGISADVVFIDNDADRALTTMQSLDGFRDDIAGVLATSRIGKVIRS